LRRPSLSKLSLFCVAIALSFWAASAAAGSKVAIIVLNENGIGSAAQAQPYLDSIVAVAAQKNGWAAAEAKYTTRGSSAERYIKKKKPEFGMVSLGAFLRLRKVYNLEVLGSVEVSRAGGRQYHLISKSQTTLAGCKGKKLASNHAEDGHFIDKVVAAGAFQLNDFELKKTRRPVQTIKKVARGKAACALIDDAQLAELVHIEGAGGIRSVWKSSKLPPPAVVAFSSASAAERAKFKSTLGTLCTGSGKSDCDKVGIKALSPSSEATYAGAIAAYQ
jgi:hypothetical protein